MAEHRALLQEQERLLRDLQAQCRRFSSEMEQWRRTQIDSASSVEVFNTSVEERLGLLEWNIVPRPEIEERYVQTSDLALNYTTKSDLQAYATKREVEMDCAQKRDLDANYATKSELQRLYLTRSYAESQYPHRAELYANFLTKSEALRLEQRCASPAYVDEQVGFLQKVSARFPWTPGSHLKGIIHHLTLECGGNVHDRGVVSITADRPWDRRSAFAARNVADLEVDSYFESADAENMWVCYDFKGVKVILTDYAIRSRFDGASQNLKSWVVEVSNDSQNWTEADRRENRDELFARNVVRTFAVSKPSVGRYVRLRQIGPNSHGTFGTCISAFELFGALTR
jgi:hypothetical protein